VTVVGSGWPGSQVVEKLYEVKLEARHLVDDSGDENGGRLRCAGHLPAFLVCARIRAIRCFVLVLFLEIGHECVRYPFVDIGFNY
jgi:hypothetical protein